MPYIPPYNYYFTLEEYDQYVLAQIKIPLCYKDIIDAFKRRNRDNSGEPIGIFQ